MLRGVSRTDPRVYDTRARIRDYSNQSRGKISCTMNVTGS